MKRKIVGLAIAALAAGSLAASPGWAESYRSGAGATGQDEGEVQDDMGGEQDDMGSGMDAPEDDPSMGSGSRHRTGDNPSDDPEATDDGTGGTGSDETDTGGGS